MPQPASHEPPTKRCQTRPDRPIGDYRPTASWANLRRRAELLRAVRAFFDQRGFLEVEPPLLSADTVVDAFIEPIGVERRTAADPVPANDGVDRGESDARRPACWWLQTSPEFAMKRLLAAGGEAIYQITRAFRRGERGAWHNPEFTIVEWYRVGDDMSRGMQLLSDLCQALLGRPPAEHVSYREAFDRWAGIDPLQEPLARIRRRAAELGVCVPAGIDPADRDAWLDVLLTECVAPRLGRERPTILYHYPASQAALARVVDGQPPVAERFELFVDGIELANGYHELTDADELRRRMRQANARRVADGRQALPEQSRLLDALEAGLPPSTGVALGLDRVLMIAVGAGRIDEVIAFPIERA